MTIYYFNTNELVYKTWTIFPDRDNLSSRFYKVIMIIIKIIIKTK